MTEEEALQIIYENLLSDDSLLIKLSMKEGLDEGTIARLEEAIAFLTTVYEDREMVPKTLAGAFVDLTPLFERALDLYSEEEQDRIIDAKFRIVTLALKLFGVH